MKILKYDIIMMDSAPPVGIRNNIMSKNWDLTHLKARYIYVWNVPIRIISRISNTKS
jgi:hypothetical protein